MILIRLIVLITPLLHWKLAQSIIKVEKITQMLLILKTHDKMEFDQYITVSKLKKI